jgi:hypothetical protein
MPSDSRKKINHRKYRLLDGAPIKRNEFEAQFVVLLTSIR